MGSTAITAIDKGKKGIAIGGKNGGVNAIGHFGKYHNTLCLSPQILHKHCFQFLLGITMIRRENKNNAYEKFGGTNKEYYGILRTGLLEIDQLYLTETPGPYTISHMKNL